MMIDHNPAIVTVITVVVTIAGINANTTGAHVELDRVGSGYGSSS
jgi:hypothetical protein